MCLRARVRYLAGMFARPWLVIPAIGVFAVLLWWVAVRAPHDGPAPMIAGSAAPVGSAGTTPTAPAAGKAAVSAPAAPQLGSGGTPAPTLAHQTIVQAWEGQTRDPSWAPETEAEIRHRLASLAGKVAIEDTSCKQNSCRITVVGNITAVGDAIARMETDEGLHGFASSIVLTATAKRPDGTVALDSYALFDR